PSQDHAGGQVRFRLRGRLDAQGSRHRAGGGARQWLDPADHVVGRPVLCRNSGHGWQSLGYIVPARAPRTVTSTGTLEIGANPAVISRSFVRILANAGMSIGR